MRHNVFYYSNQASSLFFFWCSLYRQGGSHNFMHKQNINKIIKEDTSFLMPENTPLTIVGVKSDSFIIILFSFFMNILTKSTAMYVMWYYIILFLTAYYFHYSQYFLYNFPFISARFVSRIGNCFDWNSIIRNNHRAATKAILFYFLLVQ